jgi:hypothetical protein
MERLVAWYQVGSSYGAVAALIIANLIPLVGVLWFGWDVWGILIIYWLENGIVGFFNVLKMRRASGPEDGSPMAVADTRRRLNSFKVNGRSPNGSEKAVLIPFFIMHYGTFWVVHGIFVLSLPLFATAAAEFVFLGLRESVGIDPNDFAARFGRPLTEVHPEVVSFLGDGLLEEHDGRLVLSERGLLLADSVFAAFL